MMPYDKGRNRPRVVCSDEYEAEHFGNPVRSGRFVSAFQVGGRLLGELGSLGTVLLFFAGAMLVLGVASIVIPSL